ncbi:SCO3374 family protein [Streptomyces coeruleorubidus]|uniref:SCO3374 family protein n=1 Tax=Streptomyces coeruleorubidus TaxID=116188 RepID=UPI0037936B10
MSYPYGPEVHAEHPRSLRYGRTTLRLPAPLTHPRFATVCARCDTHRNPHAPPAVALGMFGAPGPIPLPRRPLDANCRVRRWYENELGWPTVPGDPLRLAVGVRYDVLDVPAEAGRAALRHLGPHSPVALLGDRMRLLVGPGSAEELPGLLEWLEWGTLPLDLTAIGPGGAMEAPRPPWMEAPVFDGTEGSMPPRAADAPLFRGTDGSMPRVRGAGPHCEAGTPLFRGAGGSASGERGGRAPCKVGRQLFRGTDGSASGEWSGLPPCETYAPLSRETDGSMPCPRGGLMPRETGGMPPDETSALFFRETDGSVSRERGSSMPRGAGGLPADERDRPPAHETDAAYFRGADGSVSRAGGGPLPCEALMPVAAGRGGPLPRQAFAPSAPETDGALHPEPGFSRGRPLPLGRFGSQGAAVWLRPPEPGCEVEASLPTLSALGGSGDAPDLVRLVNTVAAQCHRLRLRRACAQPPALRAQGR